MCPRTLRPSSSRSETITSTSPTAALLCFWPGKPPENLPRCTSSNSRTAVSRWIAGRSLLRLAAEKEYADRFRALSYSRAPGRKRVRCPRRIGMGERITSPPLRHHRISGSRIRRIDELIPCGTEAGRSKNTPPTVVSQVVEFHCRLHPHPSRASSTRRLIGWCLATHETRFPATPFTSFRPSSLGNCYDLARNITQTAIRLEISQLFTRPNKC